MAGVVKPISIEKEYEKNPDISPDDIKKLRDWVKTQPHLPGAYLTDLDLMLVFHCCEKSMEVAKQVLDLQFTLRTIFPQFFGDNRSFDKKTEMALTTVLCAPLPTPTVDGHRAVYLKLLDSDPRNFNFVDGVRGFMMVFDLWQYEEGTWPGFELIIDMEDAVIGHVARLDINSVKKVLYFLQECMFVKLKAVHFLNAPSFMDRVMMLLKPFIKKELIDMLHIYQVGSQDVFKTIPKAAFPKDRGGEYKDLSTLRDDIFKRLRANPEFLKLENKKRVNESLRPAGKPSKAEKEFGLQGSFKKLELD